MMKIRLSTIALAVFTAAGSSIFAAAPAAATVDPAAVSSAVTTAISGATANGPTAVTDAIKAATEAQLKAADPADAKTVLQDIIADALAAGATPQEIGQALAAAALELGAPMSTEIADAVGGSGDSETLAAFDTTVAASAGGAQLAAEADGHANQNQQGGPLGMGGISAGGGVSGAGTGVGGSGCVEATCN
jgi:hypothetical protein